MYFLCISGEEGDLHLLLLLHLEGLLSIDYYSDLIFLLEPFLLVYICFKKLCVSFKLNFLP